MKTSDAGASLIKAFEGCAKVIKGRPGFFSPYIDGGGVLTIGWGHTNAKSPKFSPTDTWSQEECDKVLLTDLESFEKHVTNNSKVSLTQNEFDALVSWCYNTGGPVSASLWKVLNDGQKESIPAQLNRWCNDNGKVVQGLVRRREAEGRLFAGDIEGALSLAGVKQVSTSSSRITPNADEEVKTSGIYRVLSIIIQIIKAIFRIK